MRVKVNFDLKTGVLAIAAICLILWYTFIDGFVFGALLFLELLLVFILIQLPYEYLKSLLTFCTKWLAILLIPSLFLYWALLFIDLPSLGKFVHPVYVPFDNYIFYIKSVWDNGIFPRFNAFFLEPGHLALMCTFLTIANRYRFKQCKWLWVFLISVIFSFSLAGYILYLVGFILLKIDSIGKAMLAVVLAICVVAGISIVGEGDNAMNKLIIERLERDESSGIKGNNRFTESTDFVYEQSVKNGSAWIGVKNVTNMKVIEGAGYKIYVINYGFIGVILALFFYLALIPSDPDYRYTICYLVVLILCFFQRSAPEMYHWLFPYAIGVYLAKYEKKRRLQLESVSQMGFDYGNRLT